MKLKIVLLAATVVYSLTSLLTLLEIERSSGTEASRCGSLCVNFLSRFVGTNGHVRKLIPARSELEPRGEPALWYTSVWKDICGPDLSSLIDHPLFPLFPASTMLINGTTLHVKPHEGVLVTSVFSVDIGGSYNISIGEQSSLQTVFLIWQVTCSNMNCAGRLDFTCFGVCSLRLDKGINYTLEMATVADQGAIIDLRLYRLEDGAMSSLLDHAVDLHRLPYHWKSDSKKAWSSYKRQVSQSRASLNSEQFRVLPYPRIDGAGLFDSCAVVPTYLVRQPLARYQGIWENRYTAVYPVDNTNITFEPKAGVQLTSFGNDVIHEWDVITFSDLFKNHAAKHSLYQVDRVVSMEMKVDAELGQRFFVDALLRTANGTLVKFSEYLFLKTGSSNLCAPANFSWSENTFIYIVLTTSRMKHWTLHIIDQISTIARITNDRFLYLILVSFDSEVTDFELALRRSHIPHYEVIQKQGLFHKTLGIETAVSRIYCNDCIVLQLDQNLILPNQFFYDIRRHTVPGRMAYSPVLVRLGCGSTPQSVSGFWETAGYGIISLFKPDWDRTGGMDVERYTHSWGGEDWDFLDRILTSGLEVERKKVEGFHHLYHSRIWNS